MADIQPGPCPPSKPTRGFARLTVLAGLTIVSAECMAETAHAPLNYFLHTYGPAARPTMHLGWVLAGISAITFCFIIALLLILALRRKRPASDQRAIGREEEGMHWIYIGTGISTCILAVLMVYSMMVLNAVAKPPEAPEVTVTVTGYSWWWKVSMSIPIRPNV